jgi:hypothetical protein
MEISRMLGIGVVMIIPGFVGGGLIWNILGSWFAVFIWVVFMAVVYGGIVFKLSLHHEDNAHS